MPEFLNIEVALSTRSTVVPSQRANRTDCTTPLILPNGRRLRLFYASGPGDNIGTYRYWKDGCDDPSEPIVPYSHQFYDLCREFNADAYVLSGCSRRDQLHDGSIFIKHRPYTWRNARGIVFHLAQLFYGVRLIGSVIRFKPDVIVINEGIHWFLLTILSWMGEQVVPSLHVRFDRPGHCGRFSRILRCANRYFFRKHCRAVLVASRDIAEQVKRLTGDSCPRLIEFLPLYRRSTFSAIIPPDRQHCSRPFRVLFVGRIEVDKGIFDFYKMAKQICQGTVDIEFHVCGNGSVLPELQSQITRDDLSGRFHVYGHCDRERLSQIYSQSHVVVVPTRTSLGEGFNQVTAEAVLAGRPVVTSAVCPAIAYVRPAVVEVAADDVDAYVNGVLKLALDLDYYRQKQRACSNVAAQFYDVNNSWGAKLREAIVDVMAALPLWRLRREAT